MLKKLFFLFLVLAIVFYLSYDFIHTGKARNFILDNHSQDWAPALLYYLGNFYVSLQNLPRAEKIYEDYIEFFPGQKHYPEALYKFYYIAAKQRRKKDAFRRAKRYLEEFPDSEKSSRIERRLKILNR